MITIIMRFALLLLLALLAGTMFGTLVGFDPASLSASAYTEQQQNAIRSLNTLLPAIGAACIVLTIGLAVRAKGDIRSRALLVAAGLLLIAAGLVTRFANQPINAIVMTWTAQSPPANWAQLRDEWWHWHIVRTYAGIAALVLHVFVALGAGRAPPEKDI